CRASRPKATAFASAPFRISRSIASRPAESAGPRTRSRSCKRPTDVESRTERLKERAMRLSRRLTHTATGAAIAWMLGASAGVAAVEVADVPLFLPGAVPPLNMLVMSRDHTLYYEAYNDASDLNGDGVVDVGYKPLEIDYYGYFDSYKCYEYT